MIDAKLTINYDDGTGYLEATESKFRPGYLRVAFYRDGELLYRHHFSRSALNMLLNLQWQLNESKTP